MKVYIAFIYNMLSLFLFIHTAITALYSVAHRRIVVRNVWVRGRPTAKKSC